jgi:hypothetical protein
MDPAALADKLKKKQKKQKKQKKSLQETGSLDTVLLSMESEGSHTSTTLYSKLLQAPYA